MEWLQWLVVVCYITAAWGGAGHALLNKRDPRSALGWIVVCLAFPFAGAIAYFLFGVNRVRTRAKELDKRSRFRLRSDRRQRGYDADAPASSHAFSAELQALMRVSEQLTGWPLQGGNLIEPLMNGEQAYPAMLEAIEGARDSVFLTTYIFETNHMGRTFIDALARAVARGVDVRVLLDGVGEWYSLPRAGTLLRKRGVPVARFLPPKLIPPSLHVNLRNHRKVLVADSRIGFTGGMNIGDRHLAEREDNKGRVIDVHFRLTGTVVPQMEQAFLSDWAFVVGEQTTLAPMHSAEVGNSSCRVIVDGPNEDFDKLSAILIAAISLAHERIIVMTPYFLPSREMIAALQTAALRGVKVIVILPGVNNLPYVHWATRSMLWQLLQWDIEIYYQPPPFAHTKLFLVDDHYAQFGSANIDARSLRLNFELAVEVYDNAALTDWVAYAEKIRQRSRRISFEELEQRPLPIKIRDALAWLFSPYL